MSALGEALILLAMAAAPAVLALVVIRGRLAASGARFWSPFGVGSH
jgi:hypothetical protein